MNFLGRMAALKKNSLKTDHLSCDPSVESKNVLKMFFNISIFVTLKAALHRSTVRRRWPTDKIFRKTESRIPLHQTTISELKSCITTSGRALGQ
jgi:hypothetical protein